MCLANSPCNLFLDFSIFLFVESTNNKTFTNRGGSLLVAPVYQDQQIHNHQQAGNDVQKNGYGVHGLISPDTV